MKITEQLEFPCGLRIHRHLNIWFAIGIVKLETIGDKSTNTITCPLHGNMCNRPPVTIVTKRRAMPR